MTLLTKLMKISKFAAALNTVQPADQLSTFIELTPAL